MTPNPVDVLREFDALGVRLDVRGDRIRYDAPEGVMTPERKARLLGVKPHILELIGEPPTYRRAPRDQWCGRCIELEARGVAVLGCSECDVRIEEKESSTG